MLKNIIWEINAIITSFLNYDIFVINLNKSPV